MTAARVPPRRLTVAEQTVWLTEPPVDPTGAVIILHAPGENRTGNNYLLRTLADGCAAAGMAALRFDLPGFGESLSKPTLDAIDDLVQGVGEEATAHFGLVHWISRGLSAALLPGDAGDRLRVALCPPDVTRLHAVLAASPELLIPSEHPSPPEQQFWSAVGAEPNLVGGKPLPAALLRGLAGRLDRKPWDLAVAPPGTPHSVTGPALVACGSDPLLRSEFDRTAVAVLLPRLLKGWSRWLPADY